MSTTEQVITSDQSPRSDVVKVWDIAVRAFHWSLVITYTLAWLTADAWDSIHEAAGYFIGGLLLFRILWGLVGSKHARFRNFIFKPSTVITYLKESLHHKAKRYIGHNPAGGAMVIVLLLSLASVIGSGIAITTDMFWGVKWMEDLHDASATLTLILVGLHVAGVIFASFENKENLVKAMITGFKRRTSR